MLLKVVSQHNWCSGEVELPMLEPIKCMPLIVIQVYQACCVLHMCVFNSSASTILCAEIKIKIKYSA